MECLTDSQAALLVFQWSGINMIYSPENIKLMNWKQRVLFGGKQLKDNT